MATDRDGLTAEQIAQMMLEAARVDALFQSGLIASRPAELPAPWFDRDRYGQLPLPLQATAPKTGQ
jgi:hypothetical protein